MKIDFLFPNFGQCVFIHKPSLIDFKDFYCSDPGACIGSGSKTLQLSHTHFVTKSFEIYITNVYFNFEYNVEIST